MIKLHPAFVAFPITLFISSTIFAAIFLFTKKEQFKEFIFWTLLFGVIGAVIAVFTGLLEEKNLIHNEAMHEILQNHKYNGFAIFIFFQTLLIWFWIRKNKMLKNEFIVFFVCLIVGSGMVFFQGYLGGKMVFEYGAGVKPMEPILKIQEEQKGRHIHNDFGPMSHPHNSTASDTITQKNHIHRDSTVHRHEKKHTDTLPVQKQSKKLKDMKY